MACPCCGCPECECDLPPSFSGEDFGGGYDSCLVGAPGAENPADRCLSKTSAFPIAVGEAEFTGVNADMGVEWSESFLDSVVGCTVLLQAAIDLVVDGSIYFRFFKCNGDSYVDVTGSAVVPTEYGGAVDVGGWWCQGECGGSPPGEEPDCVTPP